MDLKNDISFEHLFELRPNTYSFTWVGENYYYWKSYKIGNETAKCKINQGLNDTFVSNEILTRHNISCSTPFQISHDKRFIIFKFDKEQEFRHSFLGSFKYLDLKNPVNFFEITPKSRYAKLCQEKMVKF